MKRFLAIVLAVMALVVGGYYLYFHTDFPLDFHEHKELQVPFRVQGTMLQRKVGDTYEDLHLRGVELSSALPGHHFSDYATTEQDYERWLGQIQEMGANVVVVTQLMDDEFYNALLAYNQAHDEPLLLIQGIMVEEAYEQASENAYGSGLLTRLVSQGKLAIDALHGRRDVVSAGIGGSGLYRSDVSEWVAGMLIMDEFDVDNVAYTDGSTTRDGSYEGTQFSTSEDATPFEAMLAQVMDEVTDYETSKYDVQRPCGFTSSPLTDPLEYDEIYARQLRKYVCVDPEHVVPTNKNSAGRMGGYRIADVTSNYQAYLSKACAARLKDVLASVNKDALYDGYLQLLSAYHSMPLVGFYTSSTARVASTSSEPITEQEQGEALCKVSNALEDAAWSGSIITSWQDVWARSNWNTSFAVYETNNYKWHDLQTPTQCEGLLAFTPGEEPVCVLDGKADEWDEAARICESDGVQLYAREDAEGIYLLLTGVAASDTLYVPFDVSPEVGVSSCADPALNFNKDVEFVLCLQGADKSKLLVQSRYNATRERFLYDIEGTDPFVDAVAANDPTFEVVRLAQENNKLLTAAQILNKEQVYLNQYDTGTLVHGNGDPAAASYNSLADFCYGTDCVEVRIPWLMLNVGDPSSRLVHRDYYDHYGVEFKGVSEMGMGVMRIASGSKTSSDKVIELFDFSLHGWQDVAYTERLKQSYDVVRAAWGGGE